MVGDVNVPPKRKPFGTRLFWMLFLSLTVLSVRSMPELCGLRSLRCGALMARNVFKNPDFALQSDVWSVGRLDGRKSALVS